MAKTKRKTFTQAEKIEFAEKHDRTCNICGVSGLRTATEAKEYILANGLIKQVKSPWSNELIHNSTALNAHPLMKKTFQIDHMIPIARGGDNSEDNLQLLCRTCNLSKSDMTMEEFYLKKEYESDIYALQETVSEVLDVDIELIEKFTKGHNILEFYPLLKKIVSLGGAANE